MSTLSETFIKKMKKIAEVVDSEKQLYFFGLVHHDQLPADRWDVLVSAKKLAPWSDEAIIYLAGLLRKTLKDKEMVKIAHVAVLPRNHNDIVSLSDARDGVEKVRHLGLPYGIDEAVIISSGNGSVPEAARA